LKAKKLEGEPMIETAVYARPPVKSLGGKRKLLSEIFSVLIQPATSSTYHEPFLGGGAVYFDMVTRYGSRCKMRLADSNLALIATYKVIRDDVELLIERMNDPKNDGWYKNTDKSFKRIREVFNELMDAVSRRSDPLLRWRRIALAHNFLYLNKTAFNGLWRVNSSGHFNVPFGRYDNPTICDAENLRACSRALQGAKLYAKDFATTPVKPGDTVYCDSPYIPINGTSNFVGYTKEGFGMADHIRLRDKALEWKNLGAFVLLSNSDTPVTRELYRGWRVKEVQAARAVNSKGDKRGKVGELLIY